MLQFIRYNFISDGNALDPYPTDIQNITNTKIQNAIYNDFYITNFFTLRRIIMDQNNSIL